MSVTDLLSKFPLKLFPWKCHITYNLIDIRKSSLDNNELMIMQRGFKEKKIQNKS